MVGGDATPLGLGFIINKTSPPSDEDDKNTKQWKGSAGTLHRKGSIAPNSAVVIKTSKEPHVILGPGQVQPKGYRLTSGRYGELRLRFFKFNNFVDIEVS